MIRDRFSFERFWAIVVKEFIQMRRDRVTFGMMVGIPLLQLVLFGYAINADPRHLPTAVVLADNGPQGRTLLYAIQNSTYFDLVRQVKTEKEARQALARNEVQFVVNIPENFSRDLLRGDNPAILIEADATDPGTTGIALGSLTALLNTALQNDFKGPLAFLSTTSVPIDLRVHALYNPEAITQYNIVPGLLGVVLTMTMVMITALAITREHESGTMENLLSMPTHPVEVMVGKIIPYILVGYIQVTLILVAAHFLFTGTYPGESDPSVWCRTIFHRRKSGSRCDTFRHSRKSATGNSDGIFLLFAEYIAFRVCISVPRDAGLGAMDW